MPYHLDASEMQACLMAGTLAPAIDLARGAWQRRGDLSAAPAATLPSA